MRILRSQKGNAFVITIMVLLIATVIGTTLITFSMNGITRNEHREKTNQAAKLAEDGIDHITLKINKELEQAIEEVLEDTKKKYYKLNFISKSQFINAFNDKFDDILQKYECDSGTHVMNENGEKKYDACYIKTPADPLDTIRTVKFKSVGTANDATKTVVAEVKLGAVYSDVPKILNYAVSTSGDGNLMLNGGVSINGDVKADGNIIVSNSAYIPSPLIERRWKDSTYPAIGGETVFPSESKNAKLFVNPSNGRLFVIKPEALDNWKGCDNKFFDRVNYNDVFKHNFHEMKESNCLYDIQSVKNVTSYLFNEDLPDLMETGTAEPFDVENMVKIGKMALAQKVIKNDNEYSVYKLPVNSSYYAKKPTWFKYGIQTIIDGKTHEIKGENGNEYFRLTALLGNNNFIDRTKYTLDGNFHLYGSNIIITGLYSSNTFKGNYYISNKKPVINIDPDDEKPDESKSYEEKKGIPRASIRIEDGKHTFDGNFYLDKGDITNKALNINRGEHTFKGVYFVDGDLEINGVLGSPLKPAIINADAIFFVNGNVDLKHVLINTPGDSGLIIFATGDITYNYATSQRNNLEDYFNEKQQEINMFLYSQKGKVELHGTVSNYKINGGVAGKNVFLTGIRGSIERASIESGFTRNFPSVREQEKSKSRLMIDYDEDIVTTFHKLQNIGITYHDLDSFKPIMVSRKYEN